MLGGREFLEEVSIGKCDSLEEVTTNSITYPSIFLVQFIHHPYA